MTPKDIARGTRMGGYIIVATGLFSLLSVIPAFGEPLRWLGDLIIWPLDGQDTLEATTTRLLLAIMGGAFAGWGVMLLLLSRTLAEVAPEALRRAALAGYAVWFVVDGLGSVLAGAPANILGNLVFLVLLVWPLRTRPAPQPA